MEHISQTKKHKSAKAKSSSGFTLVELSIVLVIIGLIVGGVLVGQDLIQAARIRATVAQLEKFDAGATTFLAKYGSRVADIVCARAFAYGLWGGAAPGTTCAAAGNSNLGNGDGVINDLGAGPTNTFAGEIPDFWNHLTEAALIPGVPSNNIPATTLGKGFWTVASLDTTPFAVPTTGSLLYYAITNVPAAPIPAANAAMTMGLSITPNEANGIDTKMDDGSPAFGKVLAADGGNVDAPTITAPAAGTTCVAPAVAGVVNYQVAVENNLCSLLIRASS